MASGRESARLVCDIGGTYARFAWAQNGRPGPVARLEVADHETFALALDTALEELGAGTKPFSLLIAAAGRVSRGAVRLTNADWEISKAPLRRRNDVAEVGIVNDFAAIALALPHLRADEMLLIGRSAAPDAALPWIVLGPGTGLGMALSVPDGAGGRIALATEGGHAPLTAPDAVLRERISAHFGGEPLISEYLVSGPGLARLYHMMSGMRADPAAIVAAAGVGNEDALGAVDAFVTLLAATANSAALTSGAFGGIYLAGGVMRSLVGAGLLDTTRFRAGMAGKSAHAKALEDAFAAAIMDDNPALLGLAAAAV